MYASPARPRTNPSAFTRIHGRVKLRKNSRARTRLPKSRLQCSCSSEMRRYERKRRRPSSTVEQWFCNFPRPIQTELTKNQAKRRDDGRQAPNPSPRTPTCARAMVSLNGIEIANCNLKERAYPCCAARTKSYLPIRAFGGMYSG